ncbi:MULTISPECIES: hypothetical protein [Natrialbaceae]|uniref:hypothetical protein n=1 Tax=Natrialbaceae TaxID=1644061 RepID=UPI00207CF57E|nr:hypothetical protein [Natronococcus sp. CG52]
MGGGGGGYNRPSNSGGSGEGSDNSDEDGSNSVPPPESDSEGETTGDQSDGSNGTNDEATPEGLPATGGGGGSGAPVAGPGEGSDVTSEEDDSESVEENTDSKKDEQKSDQEDCGEEHEEERGDEEADDNQEEDEEDDEADDEEDECLIAESALLHSPNPEPLEDAVEGDICSVRLREKAVCVVDSRGRTIGAIAEPWVSTLKECIEQGRQYRARILDIDGGKCEVQVTNKCLLHKDINLTAINTAVRDQLHPELPLSVETTTEEVVIVTADGSKVGDVPDPWAQLFKECIDQGRSYQAEVRDVTPEYCKVNIQSDTSDE